MTADVIGLHGNAPSKDAPEASSKVIPFSGITRLDILPGEVLTRALEQQFEGVVILGYLADGSQYFASTYADGGTVLWLLEKCKIALLDVGQRGEFDGSDLPEGA
jgi:hypothetical protein